MSELGLQLAMVLIRAVLALYDIVTLPIYFACQRPWNYWIRRRQVQGKSLIANDPAAPYVRKDSPKVDRVGNSRTVDELMRAAVDKFKDHPCLGTRQVLKESREVAKNGKVFKKFTLGEYQWQTYGEVGRRIDQIGRGLLFYGARPLHNLAIMAETRAEWMLAAQACIRFNIPLVTVYATLSEDGIVHGINACDVTHVIISEDMVPILRKILHRMPLVTHIVVMESQISGMPEMCLEKVHVIPFSRLEESGRNENVNVDGCRPTEDDTAFIMYTSGSTGPAKGVVTTHRNVVTTLRGFSVVCEKFGECNDDSYVAYLPLAHIMEFLAECVCFAHGAKVGYSSPHTITDTSTGVQQGCRGDISLIRPAVLVCPPLMLERMRSGILRVAAAKGRFFERFFEYVVQYKSLWIRLGFDTPILNRFVFRKIQGMLGGRVRLVACGSAPLSGDTQLFVQVCFGCPVVQGYALTETGGSATLMDTTETSLGLVGPPLLGCYLRLVDWEEGGYRTTDKPHPRGEVVVGGPCITKGYYKDDVLTKQHYREAAGIPWFYTGDIGEMYPNGSLKIIDRKKDLVKLQHGEYISLGQVELKLKLCSLVDNVCVYGDPFHTYLIALVVPDPSELNKLAKLADRSDLTFKELCEDPVITKAAANAIAAFARDHQLKRLEIPSKVKLCSEEWLPESGLVTANLKIRRKQILNFYEKHITKMYVD